MVSVVPNVYLLKFHVDTVAISLGLSSCLILQSCRDQSTSTRKIAGISALLLALAFWTKQTEIFILPAQFIYLWMRLGIRAALAHAALSFGFILALGLAFGYLFGFHELVFAMFTLPASHPLSDNKAEITFRIIESALPYILVLGLLLPLLWRHRQSSLGEWLPHQPWFLPLLASATFLPMGFLGDLKAGGTDNVHHQMYYLAAATTIALIGSTSQDFPYKIRRRFSISLVILVAILSVTVSTIRVYPRILYADTPYHSPLQKAYEYVLAHPGEVYFPWYPLAHLLGEGHLYHSMPVFSPEDYENTRARYPLSDKEINQYIPQSMRYVASDEDRSFDSEYLVRLPQCGLPVDIPELTGWTVYACTAGMQK